MSHDRHLVSKFEPAKESRSPRPPPPPPVLRRPVVTFPLHCQTEWMLKEFRLRLRLRDRFFFQVKDLRRLEEPSLRDGADGAAILFPPNCRDITESSFSKVYCYKGEDERAELASGTTNVRRYLRRRL